MKSLRNILLVSILLLLACLTQAALADVKPGDVIDKNNWQKVEGLLPPYLLEWVKKGDWVLTIGETEWKLDDYLPPAFLKARNEKLNEGRYKLDDKKGIVEIKTGKKYPRDIVGIPFPNIDPKDPDAGYKIAYNAYYTRNEKVYGGNSIRQFVQQNITRKGKIEREVQAFQYRYFPERSKTKYDYFIIAGYSAPYNLAGLSAMTYATNNPTLEMQRWTYIPQLRKVRRLSHVIRGSEAGAGTTVAVDDLWAGGPLYKVVDGVYKFIAKKEMLVPVYPHVIKMKKESDGYSVTGIPDGQQFLVGREKEGWSAAPWAFVNVVWVKRTVYEVEYRSTDPKYRYGTCRGWFDAELNTSCYNKVTDRKDKFWKGIVWALVGLENGDKMYRLSDSGSLRCVYDVNRDLATMSWGLLRKDTSYKLLLEKSIDPGIFTPGGYLRFSK